MQPAQPRQTQNTKKKLCEKSITAKTINLKILKNNLNKKRKEIKKYDYSVFSLLESSVSVVVAVSALATISACAAWGASIGWAGIIASSTMTGATRVSIDGSITFSSVVSIWAGSVTSKSCSEASTVGSSATSVSVTVSVCASITGCSITGAASIGAFSIGAWSVSIGAGSTAGAASMFMIGSCGAISGAGSFIT
jgi:hypothetical protein